jgi:hypothetical protein
VPTRTERHALAKLLNANPIGTGAAVCGNGNSVRPCRSAAKFERALARFRMV